MKRSLVRGTKYGIRASGGVGALSLPISDLFAWPWGSASSSYSPISLAGRLM